MKIILIALLIISIVQAQHYCTGNEQKFCHIIEQVCGLTLRKSGYGYDRATYQNPCEACSNNIEFYVDHSCSDYPKRAIFCSRKSRTFQCNKLQNQRAACGFGSLNKYYPPNQFQIQGTPCICNNREVVYLLGGICKNT